MTTIRNMILLIALFLLIPFTPIHALSDVYVEDTYGALSQEEVDELNAYAAQIADSMSLEFTQESSKIQQNSHMMI